MKKFFFIFFFPFLFLILTHCRTHPKKFLETFPEERQPDEADIMSSFKAAFKSTEESLLSQKLEKEKEYNEKKSDITKIYEIRDTLLSLDWAIKAHKLSKKHPPVKKIVLNEKEFYISAIFLSSGNDYNFILLYTKDLNGELVCRLLYHSQSDGSWRVTPFITFFGSFSKGADIHYTQETKLHHKILLAIEDLDVENIPSVDEDIKLEFKVEYNNFFPEFMNLDQYGINYFQKRVHTSDFENLEINTQLSILQECTPGKCFNMRDFRPEKTIIKTNDALKNLQDFVPDFTKTPKETYFLTHSLLGKTLFEVYEAKLDGRTIEWHMASVRHKLKANNEEYLHVWIDRISYPEAPLSSFGTYKEYLNSGILTNKPLEYGNQMPMLIMIKRKDGHYYSIPFIRETDTPGRPTYYTLHGFLELIEPISNYKKKK